MPPPPIPQETSAVTPVTPEKKLEIPPQQPPPVIGAVTGDGLSETSSESSIKDLQDIKDIKDQVKGKQDKQDAEKTEEDEETRPKAMQDAWNKIPTGESEKPRRSSQAFLGATYSKLVARVEIDFKESVVDAVVSFLVVFYTFILLLQTQWRGLQAWQDLQGKSPEDPNYEDWPGAELAFLVIDHIFNAIFIIEIGWRLWMHKWKFLCDIFGVFDVLVVIATSIDVYVLQPFDAGYAQNFAVGRLTRIFRLMRIFRVLRVMRFAKNLQQLRLLGDVLSKCLSPLMWALLVLGIIMVGTAVLLSQLLVEFILDESQPLDKRQWVYDYYGNAIKSTYSVFEATFSGSWPLIARPLITDVSEWYCVFWMVYQVVIGFAVMRVMGQVVAIKQQ